MPLDQQLLDRVRKKIGWSLSGQPYLGILPARTGKIDPTTGTLYSSPTIGLTGNYIWVRASFDNSVTFSRAAVPALCKVRNDLADMPVYVGYDSGGYLTAFDGRADIETSNQYQQYTAGMSVPNVPAELWNQIVPDYWLQGGLVTRSQVAPGALNIAIQQFTSQQLLFPTTDPVDLSASVPSSAGQVRWVVISIASGFDPNDPIPSITLTNGAVSTLPVYTFQMNTQAAAAISYPVTNYRLAAVLLVYGQTVIDDSTLMVDLRWRVGESYPLNNYAGSTAPTVTDDVNSGYSIDSLWYDNTGLVAYWCSDPSAGAAVWNTFGSGSGGFYQTVQDNGTPETQRAVLNFIGATVADNSGNNSTDVTIPTIGGAVSVLDVDNNSVGNVGGGTDDLITFSIPGATLAINGDYLHGKMSGSFAGNVNSKTLTAVLGSTTFFSTGALAVASAADWAIEYWIERIGATSQRITAAFTSSFGTLSGDASVTDATETLSGAITLKCTGAGTSNNDIVQKSLSVEKYSSGTGSSSTIKVATYEEQQASNTAGGSSSSGANTRNLNTEVSDINNLATLASKQITITNAGTYRFDFWASCYAASINQTYLYDITNSAVLKNGSSDYSDNGALATGLSIGTYVGVVAAGLVIELRHYIYRAQAGNGLGVATNNGGEVYSGVTITQLA